MTNKIAYLFMLISPLYLFACASQPQNTIYGNPASQDIEQLPLVIGTTTQQQVQQMFGPPEYVTVDSNGQEVWTYQHHLTGTSRSESNRLFSLILYSHASERRELSQSQSSDMLMIIFNENKVVTDYEASSSTFAAN